MQSAEELYFTCLKEDFIEEMERKVDKIVEQDVVYKHILKKYNQEITEKSPKVYSHGLGHGVNTANNLLQLFEICDGIDKGYDAVGAAILHDINRPYEVHENNGIVPNGEVSAEHAYNLLTSLCDEARARGIVAIIKHHDDPSLASHDEELMRMTALVRAADILDADVVRALACAYEYSQLKKVELSAQEIMRRWKKKVEYDLNALRNARLDERIMKMIEQHYEDTTNRMESLVALESFEDLHDSNSRLGPLSLAMKDCAIMERAKEEACREVVSRL